MFRILDVLLHRVVAEIRQMFGVFSNSSRTIVEGLWGATMLNFRSTEVSFVCQNSHKTGLVIALVIMSKHFFHLGNSFRSLEKQDRLQIKKMQFSTIKKKSFDLSSVSS